MNWKHAHSRIKSSTFSEACSWYLLITQAYFCRRHAEHLHGGIKFCTYSSKNRTRR